MEFSLSVVQQGYVYKFIVQVEGAEVVFKRDEGSKLWAIIQIPETFTGKRKALKPYQHGFENFYPVGAYHKAKSLIIPSNIALLFLFLTATGSAGQKGVAVLKEGLAIEFLTL